ncbi:MutS protein-like protein [Smittium culicis]|uniref:MutS protein-like protein n=1 Tax=Smittium culicis TaxID=133412 RepID=A0A1R1YP66_9FUNG|nr:MutS protein-like protein [Smittium culicis]
MLQDLESETPENIFASKIPKNLLLSDSNTTINSKVLKIVKEYRKIYPDCVLLTRVGDFYELYFDQADHIGGSLLGLQVVNKKYGGSSVRFTGFPSKSIERYLEILVGKFGRSVAICEQFKIEDRPAYYRRVSRIITPGTWVNSDSEHLISSEYNSSESFSSENVPATQTFKKISPNSSNQYLVSISKPKFPSTLHLKTDIGLSWTDLSTGDFYTCESSLSQLSTDMARIRPREIILSKGSPELLDAVKDIFPFSNVLNMSLTNRMTSPPETEFEYIGPTITVVDDNLFEDWIGLKDNITTDQHEDSITLDLKPVISDSINSEILDFIQNLKKYSVKEHSAALSIINYSFLTQVGKIPLFQLPSRFNISSCIRMSQYTISALEIVRPIESSYASSSQFYSRSSSESDNKNTLISDLMRTKTSSGSRLFTQRILSPSTCKKTIEERLDFVEFFFNDQKARSEVSRILTQVNDIERCIQRLSLDCGTASDIMRISNSLQLTTSLIDTLLFSIEKELLQLEIFSSQITQLINSQSLQKISTFKRNSILKKFQLQSKNSRIIRLILDRVSNLVTLPKLVDSINSTFIQSSCENQYFSGRINEVNSQHLTDLILELEKKAVEKDDFFITLQNKYRIPSLRINSTPALGVFIEGLSLILSETELLKDKIQQEESRIFQNLRKSVLEFSHLVKVNIKILSELDIASSLGHIAYTRGYTRPEFSDSFEFKVTESRHPVIELRLIEKGFQFVGNDIEFDKKNNTILLTGPNMGGKSTYLRQVAILSIMAQMGSFVAATKAKIPIVDSIYSRIGAHDNLALNQSTFMVEMKEAAEILNNATERSLVIMDEIGRGTSVTDGMSIAYASLGFLHTKVKCMTLFATHYHEITKYFQEKTKFKNIKMMQTAIVEVKGIKKKDSIFSYIHKIKPGVCQKSHGIYVAQSAGIPKSVIDDAKKFSSSF